MKDTRIAFVGRLQKKFFARRGRCRHNTPAGFLFSMSYAEQLKDPRWQRKRTEIMVRDDFSCRHCFSNTDTLNVHHIKYGQTPWDIEDKYLITLCEDCHEYEEDLKGVDIYQDLKELGITKYRALLLIKSVTDRYKEIENIDALSWEDTIKMVIR